MLLLVTSLTFGQIEDPTDPIPTSCNLVSNPDMVFPGLNNNYCLNFIEGNIPGWSNGFRSPKWRKNTNNCVPLLANQFIVDFLSTNFLPNDNTGNAVIFGYQRYFEQENYENLHTIYTDGISAKNLTIAPNTKYILSYLKSDGMDQSSVEASGGSYTSYNQRVSKNKGMNVYINKSSTLFPHSSDHLMYFHYPDTNTITHGGVNSDTSAEIQFEANSTEIITDNSIEYAWSQTVTSFTSPNDSGYQFLTFVNTVGYNFLTVGNQYSYENEIYAINLDKVELIEDKLHETPATYTLNCGENVTIGIELCDVGNMEYQWWDVTGTPIQLTDLSADAGANFDSNGVAISLPSNYGVEIANANGSQIILTNFDNTSQLELRRVFPSTFSESNLPIHNYLDPSDNVVSVDVSCGGSSGCDSCDEVNDYLLNTLNNFEATSCGEYTLEIPQSILDCYEIKFVVNGELVIMESTSYDFSFSEPGSYPVTLVAVEIGGNRCGPAMPGTIDVPDCFDPIPCMGCEEVSDAIIIQQEINCGTYQIFQQSEVTDCFRIDYYINSVYQGILNQGSNLIDFTTNGTYMIDIAVVDITASPEVRCAKKSKKIVINCHDTTSEYFVTSWNTALPGISNSSSITIPTNPNFIYNYDIDWNNDGVFDEFGVTGNTTHDFGVAGTYKVTIRGDFPQLYFSNQGDKQKIISVDQWGTQVWQSMEFSFNGCSNIHINALDSPNLSAVESMNSMFRGASVMNEEISSWDVSYVKNMRFMFAETTMFNQDISTWNTSLVKDMVGMFFKAFSFNQNLGNWNIESLENAKYMFAEVTLSLENYDALLLGWSSQNLMSNVFFDGGNSTYCIAEQERASMINSNNWTISDSGLSTTCRRSQLEISPNPASKTFEIDFNNIKTTNYDVIIRSTEGEVVLSAKNQSKLKIDSLPIGLYFVEVITLNGYSFHGKLIIK